jgi:hypothetical protein
VRFAHRTLSLHGTLPEVPLWNKEKLRRDCAEAVEFAGFLWKEKEKQEEIHRLHSGKFSCQLSVVSCQLAETTERSFRPAQ